MHARSVHYRTAAAVALALLASSPSAAQGLDQRLTDAQQRLSENEQACRPIDISEYQRLLDEAVRNKQRAEKAKRAGVPVDDAQVNADLANASSLFARAQAALVQQCIRDATRLQPQPQTTPPAQTTGPAPGASAAPAQGLTGMDQQEIASQQRTIESFEAALGELRTLLQQGKCAQAEDLVDELDEWLDDLENPARVRPAGLGPAPRIPPRLIQEWDRRIDELLDSCPQPGRPRLDISSILQSHNAERARWGYQPLRWSLRLADNAQNYAHQLAQSGQLAHASREGRGIERENISQGLNGWNTGQLMATWFDERAYFKPGTFPNVSTIGNWYDVGHYSQAIWPTTTSIGCGLSYGSGFSWLVCRYSPGGNKDGKPVGLPAL